MASIVLSFVGNQDPASEHTNQEGSIVTLVRHLINTESTIKKVLLLYTEDTHKNAILTQEWLKDDLEIDTDKVDLISVSPALSEDPIDVRLAAKEANTGLNKAREYQGKDDIFEFNSSSGTPSMKTAWGILQASGYGKNTRLWQVRNPKTMKPSQELVFENNVNVFKNESDLKVIKKQLENYNYRGALDTFESGNFNTDDLVESLLNYGYYRLAFDFELAQKVTENYQQKIKPELIQNIDKLCNQNILELLQEVYYKSVIKIKTKQYSDFLVLLSSFQENTLKFLVKRQLISSNSLILDWNNTETKIKAELTQNQLMQHLKNYQYKGRSLNLGEKLNRIILLTIVEYFSDLNSVTSLLKELDRYSQHRNDLVHDLKGISELENEGEIIKTMRQILEFIKPDFETTNPFNLLNEQILNQLTPIVRG